MSGIAGVYHLDKKPIDRPLLGRMLECIPQWGSDAVRIWSDNYVGLGHRQLCTTEESLREVQPANNRAGTCWITFDGRVDNREELIKRLRNKFSKLQSATDVELVLCAYDIWGTECLKSIVGDFAFALWDANEEQLFCGRDTYGIRPFYYHFDRNTFTFGSDIVQLFQNPNISQAINSEKIAEWLTWCGLRGHRSRNLTRTFFRQLSELPFAHYLVIKRSGLALRRYWDIDPKYTIRHRSQENYIEHFSHLFRQAVQCRLRSCGPVGAELSGKLDSSCVVSIAQEIYRAGEIRRESFITFSMVFDELSCDQQSLINTVTEKFQLDHRNVVTDNIYGLRNFPPDSTTLQNINNPDQLFLQNGVESLYQLACDRNIRVMLSGEGAKSHVLGAHFVLDSLIRHFKWGELFNHLKIMRSQSGIRSAMNDAMSYGIAPLLPKRISKRLYYKWIYPALYHPDFGNIFSSPFHELLLSEVANQKDSLSAFPTFKEWGRQKEYEALNPGSPELGIPIWLPIERRFPFLDRRLVEFCLAIPPEQKYQHLRETRKRNIRGRLLQRSALLQGILPDEIGQSQMNLNFSDVCKRRFTQFKNAYIQMFAPPSVPLIVAFGFVDGAKVWQLINDALGRAERSQEIDPFMKLWINRLTLLEIWLQSLRTFKNVHNASNTNGTPNDYRMEFHCSRQWSDFI